MKKTIMSSAIAACGCMAAEGGDQDEVTALAEEMATHTDALGVPHDESEQAAESDIRRQLDEGRTMDEIRASAQEVEAEVDEVAAIVSGEDDGDDGAEFDIDEADIGDDDGDGEL